MKKVQVISKANEPLEIEVAEQESLLDALLSHGVFVDTPCNGKGTCGKCKVRISEGALPAPTASEEKLLRKEELGAGVRLACLVTDWDESISVEVLQKEGKSKVLSRGTLPDFDKQFRDGYGICVDIGTTTVTLSLIDLSSGKFVVDASMVNMQKSYGLDVLTRISYASDHEDGCARLQEAIVGVINSLIVELCRESGIEREEIAEILVAANTTMAHLFLGVNPAQMGRFPYTPVFTEAKSMLASEIGLEAGAETRLYTLPHVSAFIGADVVAGVYVAGMQKKKGNLLFIDIGTNGEIVLAKDGVLYSCSCAAGPALEGMNISCGMRAEPGAIEDVLITESGVQLKTIDNEPPIGICGSGILAAVKELLRSGLVTDRGAFIKKDQLDPEDYRYEMIALDGRKREFVLQAGNGAAALSDDAGTGPSGSASTRLCLTQNDVRQVQLAKGAILSGFLALLQEAELSMEDLDVVYVAGQFGAHLPADSLVGTGILPPEVKDKIQYLGNSAKSGAYMALMNQDIREEMDKIAEDINYVELAVTKNYEQIFRDAMMYPRVKDG